ncbi:hypothetical protein Q9233_006524 [Columba guinea]|nr:hypothetical protein Q9233_006524 [Columba guinea]
MIENLLVQSLQICPAAAIPAQLQCVQDATKGQSEGTGYRCTGTASRPSAGSYCNTIPVPVKSLNFPNLFYSSTGMLLGRDAPRLLFRLEGKAESWCAQTELQTGPWAVTKHLSFVVTSQISGPIVIIHGPGEGRTIDLVERRRAIPDRCRLKLLLKGAGSKLAVFHHADHGHLPAFFPTDEQCLPIDSPAPGLHRIARMSELVHP